MKLIGLAGKAGSGKDTLGEYLITKYNIKSYALAEPLKKAASIAFDIPLKCFYNSELKETLVDDWHMTPRELMQTLGTEYTRDVFRKDIWIRQGHKKWLECQKKNKHYAFLVTDIRFQNDAEWLKNEGGIIIKVKRDAAKNMDHESEIGFTENLVDYVIDNNSSLEEFYKNIENTVENIF